MSEKENKNKPNIKVVKLGTWFFPVVVISIILLINLFNGGLDMNYPKTTSISSFYDLLNKNQIEKVDILTSSSGNTAEVTLKKGAYKASKDEELKKVTKEKGPHYLVKDVGSLELFQNELKEAKKSKLISAYDIQPTSNWSEWIGLLLPTLIFIGFFYFISKRMAGGAGGGGQIFSIGKSKAKLFDEKNDVKVIREKKQTCKANFCSLNIAGLSKISNGNPKYSSKIK